ncbi:MAG: response regulator [Elusimicrobia bacterium]|nr:response regulator [Elusimicrobiota bacterium]
MPGPSDADRAALDNRLRGILTKTSTFVSIDVVDSTGMKLNESEEDVIFSFLGYQHLAQGAIKRHGGSIVSITGDGVMSRFSNSREGITSALYLLENLPEFNRSGNLLKNSFRIRIGINTGKVYVDSHEEAATLQILPSSAIDVAGYLQKHAPINGAWISQFSIEQLDEPFPGLRKNHFDEKLGLTIYLYEPSHQVPEGSGKGQRGPAKILIIEDEPDQALEIAHLCQTNGYQTGIAFDGSDALIYLRAFEPDLVLLDIGLPRMDGWHTLHELKANKMAPRVPVLMLARRYKMEDIERSFSIGASGCIKKPFDSKRLLRKIEILLAR